MIGQELDHRYRVLRRLGRGAMGDVYLVEHLQLGRFEALKLLRADLVHTPTAIARFRREARAISRLSHRNIVGIHDVGRLNDGRLYMSTEYADGEPLDSAIQAGPLSLSRTISLLTQLADAVAHAHSHRVIHRDLKPSNIMLVERRAQRDIVKVLDFGIAKIIEAGYVDSVGTRSGAVYGTPLYIAPEMVRGVQDDPRLDLYSFGCIAWEMLTGQPLFTGRVMDVMHAHVTVAPRAPSKARPGIPPELDDLVLRCLRKDPADRFQSGAAIVAALIQLPTLRESPEIAPLAAAELRIALQAVAEALLDAGCEAPDLVIAGADLEQLSGELRHINAEAREIERQHDAAEAQARGHECSLRFALSALRSHQDRQNGLGELEPATDDKIEQLEARVAGVARELKRTSGVLSDAALTVALKRDEVELKLAEAERALEQAVIASYQSFADDPGVAEAGAKLPVDLRDRVLAAGPERPQGPRR